MTQPYLGMFSGNNISSLSSNLHCDDIIKHPELPWTRSGLSGNVTMTLKHWNIINEGWTNNTLPPAKEPVFGRLNGIWDYSALAINFERQEPKALSPLPDGILIIRESFWPKSVDQIDWFEANYPDRLIGAWSLDARLKSFCIEEIRELYRRKLITKQESHRWISAHPSVTLQIIGPINPKTSYWDYGALLEKLPVEDVLELIRRYPRETRWHLSRPFNRVDTSSEHFDRWALLDKTLCGPRERNTHYHGMFGSVIGAVGLDYLLQWPDVDKLPWSRNEASSNMHLPVGWLMTVFDKWPKVRGTFNIESLTNRASIVEYILHLRHRVKKGDRDGAYFRRVLIKSSKRKLLLAFVELQRHHVTFHPTVLDLSSVNGITLEDFYFFHPQHRPTPSITTCFRFPKRLYDVDLITV
jgi:hypothetical protein